MDELIDHYAKLWALAHEKPSPEQEEWLDRAIAVAGKVCLPAAKLLPLWPACDLSRAIRVKVEPPPPAPKPRHAGSG